MRHKTLIQRVLGLICSFVCVYFSAHKLKPLNLRMCIRIPASACEAVGFNSQPSFSSSLSHWEKWNPPYR